MPNFEQFWICYNREKEIFYKVPRLLDHPLYIIYRVSSKSLNNLENFLFITSDIHYDIILCNHKNGRS